MELESKTVEELIAAVLDDISQKGFSSVMPFSIGSVEVRMCQFADAYGIELASQKNKRQVPVSHDWWSIPCYTSALFLSNGLIPSR
jgi:hypothetical protein